MIAPAQPGILIIVENEPVPVDRRVWLEALALQQAGYQVSIICPKGPGGQSSRESLEGIEIYRHLTWTASGRFGYLLEYSLALAAEFVLACRLYWRRPFGVIQACNPPDTGFLVALPFKLLGVRFVFDHHDLAPELYDVKFVRRGIIYRIVRLAELLSFRFADLSIATNESYREIAITRGHMPPERVVTVQTCADLCEVNRSKAVPALKRGKRHMVLYVGMMESQDGVRLLIESIDHLVKQRHREDTQFVLVGAGSELPRLKTLAVQLGLSSFVEFTGLLPHDQVRPYLSTADVCVAPDPLNPLNDKSTMIKILEYMAFGRPVVLYDLTEGRLTVGEGGLYARPDDPIDFADQIEKLLDSELLRNRLGAYSQRRTVEELNWSNQSRRLVTAFSALLNGH